MTEEKQSIEVTFTVSYDNTQHMRDKWRGIFNSVEPKLLNPITGETTSIKDITIVQVDE